MPIQPEIVEFDQVVDTNTFVNWVKNRTASPSFLVRFGREVRGLYMLLGTTSAKTTVTTENLEMQCGAEDCHFAHPVKIVKMVLTDVEKPDNQASGEWCFLLDQDHDIIGIDEPSAFPKVKELLKERGTISDCSPERILH